MISVIGRSSHLAPSFKATVQAVSIGSKELVNSTTLPSRIGALDIKTDVHDLPTKKGYLSSGFLTVRSGLTERTQVRGAHTDLKIPVFDHRKSVTEDVQSRNKDSMASRNAFAYIVTGGAVMTGAYMAKSTVRMFVSTWLPPANVMASGSIEIDMKDIAEGRSMTFKWRQKPLFVMHRTAKTIETEAQVDVASLRDPEHDLDRVKSPEWLVVVGVCTHLGCVPIADAGNFGGYYCPCHGSHYDGSGRIRQGPAPLNLEVAPHEIRDGKIVVG